MSTEEQDQILGKLIREDKELAKTVAALEAKLLDMAKAYGAASTAIGAGLDVVVPRTPSRIEDAINAVSDQPTILRTVSELDAARKDHASVKERLAKLHP